jgi:hypothetical protein
MDLYMNLFCKSSHIHRENCLFIGENCMVYLQSVVFTELTM